MPKTQQFTFNADDPAAELNPPNRPGVRVNVTRPRPKKNKEKTDAKR